MRIQQVLTSAPGQPDFTNNTWVVGDERECVVIDPAHDAAACLERIGSARVVAIVITHGHWDHVAAAPALREATGAPILLHPEDRFLWNETHPEQVPDGELTDLQILTVAGGSLQVRHTPGHTPGSCSLVAWRQVPASGEALAIFTGDTLFPGGPGATRWEYSDFPRIIDSIREKIFTLPGATPVNPGHGASTTVAAEAPHLEAWRERGW